MKYIGENGKDILIESDETKLEDKNELDHWIQKIDDGEHDICPHECFISHGTRIVSGKVLRHVEGEENILENKPTNVVNYWTVVKKWYEHKIPLNEGDKYVYSLKPVYTYFVPRGSDEPVIYQAKEHKKDAMYFLPDDCENHKECNIEDLIPIEENSVEFIIKETSFGDKLFAKIPYEEDFYVEAKDKIYPYELADACIETYWNNGKLNMDDYKVTSYIS